MKKEKNIVSGHNTGISQFNLYQVHRNSGWGQPTLLIFKLYVL